MAQAVPQHVGIAAQECIRVLFPEIKVTPSQITPEAAAFIFTAVSKLRLSSLMTHAMFKLYRPIPPQSATGLSLYLAKAIIGAVAPMSNADLQWNLVSYNFVIAPHRQNLANHLRDPETFPCPDYAL